MTRAAPIPKAATGVECFPAMGTRIELHRFGAGDADALWRARAAIVAVDDALTIHRPSAATAMNDALRAGQPAAIDDPILLDALLQIDAAYALTLGLFDPVADARHAAGWRQLHLDHDAARLACDVPVALDFGGIGKGLALDYAVAALRGAGVECALLSAGESSIAVVGAHPLGAAWPFAIPDPRHPDAALVEVELFDEALSVSATIGTGTTAPERAALIRPATGAGGDTGAGAIDAPRCAVVIDRNGSRAEMLSTALIVASDDALQHLQDPRRRMLFDLAPHAPRRILE